LIDEERQLWRLGDVECVMVSCCSGAELQVRKAGEVVLRELFPLKSDLYERANDLKAEYGRGGQEQFLTGRSSDRL
jgi:hypothetical protein